MHAICSVGVAGWRHSSTRDSLRGHVALAPNVRLGYTGDEIAADTKVADLDLASGIDQDVGGLDIAVDDVVLILEGLEAHDG